MDTVQSTALTVPQRAAVALKADERRTTFIELAKQSAEIVAVTNPASYQELHAARMRLKNARVEITKEGKDVRDDAVQFQKGVIALEAELIAIIQPEEERLRAIQHEHDSRIERERQAKIEAEERRVGAIRSRIEEIRIAGATFTVVAGAVVIGTHLDDVKAIAIDDSFAEFKAEAEAAKVASVVRLTQLREAALAHEAEQRQMRADREELERMRKEEELRVKQAAERDAAAIRQRAIDAAAQQAEFDRIEREARLKREADDRKAQEARDEADRVARLAREAEQRRLQEEADRLAAERRAVEEAQRKQREEQEKAEFEARAKAIAEQDARDAAARERQRKTDELLGARDMLVTFRNRYAELTEFAKVHKAIDAYMTSQNAAAKKAA